MSVETPAKIKRENTLGKFLRRHVEEDQVFLMDGSFCAELENREFYPEELPEWTAAANFDRDGLWKVEEIYRRYFGIGCTMVTANTYHASMQLLQQTHTEEEAKEAIKNAIMTGVKVRSESYGWESSMFMVSIGPYGVNLRDASEYNGWYAKDRDHIGVKGNYPYAELQRGCRSYTYLRKKNTPWQIRQKIREYYQQQYRLISEYEEHFTGYLFETLPSMEDVLAVNAILMGDANSHNDAIVSVTCTDEKTLRDGTPLKDIVPVLVDNPRIVAIGVNCSSPWHAEGQIKELVEAGWKEAGKHIIVYPNSGNRISHEKLMHPGYDTVTMCERWIEAGAIGVGGCCGVDSFMMENVAMKIVNWNCSHGAIGIHIGPFWENPRRFWGPYGVANEKFFPTELKKRGLEEWAREREHRD